MQRPHIFNASVTGHLIARIGQMSAARMLAHCCVTYEMLYGPNHRRRVAVARMFLRAFVKKGVVSAKPYAKSGRTSSAFLIHNERDFDREKQRLTEYLQGTQALSRSHFEQRESIAFGPLSGEEWKNLFYKHPDHALRQFGV